MQIPAHGPHRLRQQLRSSDRLLLLPALIVLAVGVALALLAA